MIPLSMINRRVLVMIGVNSPERKKMSYGVWKWTLKPNRGGLLSNPIDVELIPIANVSDITLDKSSRNCTGRR